MRSRTGLSSAGGHVGDRDRDGGCGDAVGADLGGGRSRAKLHGLSLDRALITSLSLLDLMVSLPYSKRWVGRSRPGQGVRGYSGILLQSCS